MEALFEECKLFMATSLTIWWCVDVLVFHFFFLFLPSFSGILRFVFLLVAVFIPARSNDGVINPEFAVKVEVEVEI